MSMSPPAPAAATVNPETREFWVATTQARLLLKHCRDCGNVAWYPRTTCPECWSLRTEWFEASGCGRVYSYTVNYRGEDAYADAAPYVLAYVELDEGPGMMTNLVEADGSDLGVGLPVEVVSHDTGEGSAPPRFRLAASHAAPSACERTPLR